MISPIIDLLIAETQSGAKSIINKSQCKTADGRKVIKNLLFHLFASDLAAVALTEFCEASLAKSLEQQRVELRMTTILKKKKNNRVFISIAALSSDGQLTF